MTDTQRREILNIDEAAELLGVSVKTFNKVLHTEGLPGRKFGREWKFSRQALIDWIGSGRSDRFYEITPAPNGRQDARAEPGQTSNDDRPSDGKPGPRRTSGWRLELD